jgi:hypothetical protein
VVAIFGFIASVIGAILSPLGLLVAGLIALGVYLISTADVGSWFSDILAWLGDSFAWLKDTALKAWGAIGTAVASGNLTAAFNVAWTGIKAVWLEGTSWLYEKWVGVKGWFLQIWNEAVYGTAILMTDAWAGMQQTWVSIISGMKVVWSEFTTWAANLWNTMQQGIGNVFLSALEKVGVLTAEESAAAKADMNKTLDTAKAERSKTATAYQEEINADAARRKKAITAERDAADQILAGDMSAKDAARKKQMEADIAAQKAAAEAAGIAFNDAVAMANAEAGAEMPGGPGKPKLAGVDAVGAGKVASTGSFNAATQAGLGFGSAQEETAKNTREMIREQRKLRTEGILLKAT